jgi:cytochrome P450
MNSVPEFDPHDPAMLENPYPYYAELRQHHPVFWHEGLQSWVLTRYDDCRDVLENHGLFSRDRRRTAEVETGEETALQTLEASRAGALRRLLMSALNASDRDQLAVNIRAKIGQIFESLAARPSFDWMTDVASPLAASVAAEFLGVSAPEAQSFRRISDGIAEGFDEDIRPEIARVRNQARAQYAAIIDGWLSDEETYGPALALKSSVSDIGLPADVLRNSVGLLFSGSWGTIYGASGNIALILMRQPELLEQFRDEAMLGTGVNELVRYEGPSQALSRVALRRTQIRGVTIEPGQVVITLSAAANRDPAEFTQPDEIILDRKPNKHLGFGWGAHSCIGAAFGQLALRELVSCLLNAPGALRLAGQPVRLRAANVRVLASLPATFQA